MSRRARRAAKKGARSAMRSGSWGEWEHIEPSEWRAAVVQPPEHTVAVHRNRAFIVLERELDTAWGVVRHLMVRPTTEKAGLGWAVLQRVKRELVGDVTAVEVYPTEEELVDVANMYHLWCLPRGFELPFSLKGRP